MIIKRLELLNVKSFREPIDVKFDADKKLFAFSGINGSGKSTIIKSIWYIQKLYFANKAGKSEAFFEELNEFLSKDVAYISCEFCQGEATGSIKLFRHDGNFKIQIENEELFDLSWGKDIPENLILFIDSNRIVQNPKIDFTSISLENFSESKILTSIIENPNEIFSTIYEKIISDYIYSRLLPAKPDRLTYFHVAQKFFEKLIPHVSIKNFSGKHVENQFVLLGKNGSDSKSKQYDIRNFSSGEKALFSILNLLFLTNKISTIIIDEPENNFHSSLLMNFIGLLKDFCDGKVLSKLKELNSPESSKVIKEEWITSLYENMTISQVILATHSKDLIYRVFAYGKNFIVSDEIVPLEEENAETPLRLIGLSQVDKRVLFVEGKNDKLFLEGVLAGHDITIKDLSGGESVISTWKKIQKIKKELRNIDFVFLVDSDNRKYQILDDARAIDAEFCDASLLVLDRHEMESYLIDIDTIFDSIESLATTLGKEVISKENIVKEVEDSYVKTRVSSILKDSNNKTREFSNSKMADALWGSEAFKQMIKSKEYVTHDDVMSCFGEGFLESISGQIAITINETHTVYRKGLKYEDFINLCDGKAIFSRLCGRLGEVLGVTKKNVHDVILRKALSSDASLLKVEITNIIRKFPNYHSNLDSVSNLTLDLEDE
ncbi:AAA family ATPase [Acidocella aromatica]|uniref:ABC-type lipoprotein export system ATPase subunit n=1 Tax=Acidocella aromatica TaxID=1303579 RepID=A0A840VWJ1_9PROT|nr:AAA family ATPase [Acidocella aromatica]MBB5374492.1 ABC-type lipoprotein export system ATPase subunit [Acidocella aromatica]